MDAITQKLNQVATESLKGSVKPSSSGEGSFQAKLDQNMAMNKMVETAQGGNSPFDINSMTINSGQGIQVNSKEIGQVNPEDTFKDPLSRMDMEMRKQDTMIDFLASNRKVTAQDLIRIQLMTSQTTLIADATSKVFGSLTRSFETVMSAQV